MVSALVLPVAQAGPTGLLGSPFLLVAVLFLVMYVTMIRPQARQAKAHRALVEGLQKNDRVVTQGGIHGTITRIDDTTVVIAVEDGTKIRVERSRIAVVLSKDAPKGAAAETTVA
ncbi:MAG TPA: preprotein translocase subunit YajC [Rubricoccaceae bacterium]|jgi:preprotein translocase subunit YajC